MMVRALLLTGLWRAVLSCCLGLAWVATAPAAERDGERSYILATANTGGTYYPVGVALATLVKIKLGSASGISMSAINSAGSAENIKLMADGEAQFALLQGINGAWAWRGSGDYANLGPQKYLRSVTVLWRNIEHFILRKQYATSGTVHDLEGLGGRRFSVGNRNSGARGSTSEILRRLGIALDGGFRLTYLGYGPSADALQNGTIAGVSLPGGPPVSAVTRVFAAVGEDLVLLEFTDADVERVSGSEGLWTAHLLPAGTYPGQTRAVRTISEPNFLAVRADVDEDAVHAITKAIYENLDFLSAIHPATRELGLDKALAGLIAPLHPGAARFYREQGLDIPTALVAE